MLLVFSSPQLLEEDFQWSQSAALSTSVLYFSLQCCFGCSRHCHWHFHFNWILIKRPLLLGCVHFGSSVPTIICKAHSQLGLSKQMFWSWILQFKMSGNVKIKKSLCCSCKAGFLSTGAKTTYLAYSNVSAYQVLNYYKIHYKIIIIHQVFFHDNYIFNKLLIFEQFLVTCGTSLVCFSWTLVWHQMKRPLPTFKKKFSTLEFWKLSLNLLPNSFCSLPSSGEQEI